MLNSVMQPWELEEHEYMGSIMILLMKLVETELLNVQDYVITKIYAWIDQLEKVLI